MLDIAGPSLHACMCFGKSFPNPCVCTFGRASACWCIWCFRAFTQVSLYGQALSLQNSQSSYTSWCVCGGGVTSKWLEWCHTVHTCSALPLCAQYRLCTECAHLPFIWAGEKCKYLPSACKVYDSIFIPHVPLAQVHGNCWCVGQTKGGQWHACQKHKCFNAILKSITIQENDWNRQLLW